MSLLGEVRLARGYYHCPACHRGHVPWDKKLRLTCRSLTPGAEEVVSSAGLKEAFGEVARRTLKKLSGVCLSLSESTVQRTTEDAGRRLGERLAASEMFGPKQSWPWHRDATGLTCGYVSIDVTGVLMQRPNGSKAAWRMWP